MERSAVGAEYFESILAHIERHGMDHTAYKKIALGFTQDTDGCATPVLRKVLRHYVGFRDAPLYVNEIKNFLAATDPALFREYGSLFISTAGCLPVFGIGPANAPRPHVPCTSEDEEPPREKNYARKKKRREKNVIKKQARATAVARHMERIGKKAEKKAKRAEFEEMVRRENGS